MIRAHCTICGRALLFCVCRARRQRVTVRGTPIERAPLFPVVRFALIGLLTFAGVSEAASETVPIEPEPPVAAVAWTCTP